MRGRKWIYALVALAGVAAVGLVLWRFISPGCEQTALSGFRPIASDRLHRFLGKISKETAVCRGDDQAALFLSTPWVDWQGYWGAGDAASKGQAGTDETARGVTGALTDLEYQRMELIKFNLFDNSGTYQQYVEGRAGVPGPVLKVWPEMRLPSGHPHYNDVGGAGTAGLHRRLDPRPYARPAFATTLSIR